jgi:peptide/nickel transport system permease protein
VVRYILTRLAWSALIVIVSSIVIFLVLRVLPGDPVLARLGASTGVDPAAIERLRVEAGLNDPLLTQYFTWASGIFRGNV